MNLTHLDLMLASAPDTSPEEWLTGRAGSTAWVYQRKVDGIRVLAADGRLITRNGYDVTEQFPEVDVPGDWWLDAEIAVVDAAGKADFEAANRRAKGGHGGDATLFVFDVLAIGRVDVRRESYEGRWLHAFGSLPQSATVQLLPVHVDGYALWVDVVAGDEEGLIARRAAGTYKAGRSSDMVKLKRRTLLDCIVVGKTPSSSSERPFGALQLALIDDAAPGGYRRVGEVGSGFSVAELVDVMEELAAGRPFVVEVEHMGWTSAGKLRHPVFHRVRPDVDVLSCTAP